MVWLVRRAWYVLVCRCSSVALIHRETVKESSQLVSFYLLGSNDAKGEVPPEMKG